MVVDGVADPTALVRIPLAMFNRHGLVAGATGTGKTKTLQVIAEQLSAAGVPVRDAGRQGRPDRPVRAGEPGDRITERAAETGDDWAPAAFPVEFLVARHRQGIGVPVRATIDPLRPDPAVRRCSGSTTPRNRRSG